MDSPTVQRAAVALLIALTLAAIGWAIQSLVGAVAVVNSILTNSILFNSGYRSTYSSERIWMVGLSVAVVVVLAIAAYLLFDRWLNAVKEVGDKEADEEE